MPGGERPRPCYRPALSVSESTLEAPPVPPQSATAVDDRTPSTEQTPWTLRLFVSEHPGWATAVVLLVVSVVLVAWARTRPSYDAYGWLVWGYQTLHGTLDLGGAPSWKPLTYLFTVPLALFGHYEMWLWMFFSTAVALAGAVFAGRIAYRLSGGGAVKEDEPALTRYAPIAAAIFAGAAVLGLQQYMHYVLSFQSDPMLVTFVLAAIDMHLLGKYRWTLVFGVLATLGRPEAGPWLALWGLWAWIKLPSMRWMLVAGALVVAFGWFGIPTITNHRPLLAGDLAQKSPRALRHNQFFGTLGRFRDLEYTPVWIAALVTHRRRDIQARPRDPDARCRRGRLGDRRDRVRLPRLAGAGPLHVRARGGRRGARRRGGGPGARGAPPAATRHPPVGGNPGCGRAGGGARTRCGRPDPGRAPRSPPRACPHPPDRVAADDDERSWEAPATSRTAASPSPTSAT